ncbi:ThiF family adenylyltransferase [Enterobacter pseudoroggenkampii]|uniref:HesA/MoeB/ThiF family protein n=1 Tax=Enterobacterales TaxID=91347 RepID=UPI000E0F47DA|nr:MULTISPECIES: ThiF family adenylyltransferase [Enterobacterales]NJQ21772.1 ThiF family adenylyltransferase [Pantoea sp. LS15]NKF48368.1 ThiF family adenylyltransferase [Pantoea sp. LS15]RDK12928.1 ThiF family adenylyltransferase [Enterobacter sp. 9-2]WJW93998.1 ThiF family adenylyltransferase [Enterobacter pseudoroggenkampii]
MEYVLGRHVKIARFGKGGLIGGGSKEQLIEDLDLWEKTVQTAYCFIEPKDYEHARLELKKVISEEQFLYCYTFLLKYNFIIPAHYTESFEENRYSRNYLHYQSYGADPEVVQEKLRKSKVVILGCGGIGNHTSAVLATAGVGEIVLVDDDEIEMSNLTRQILFTEDDVGSKKNAIMKRELLRRNSAISVSELSLQIKTYKDLEHIPEADIWIVSADHPFNLINWVNKYCVTMNQAYINAGYVNDISVFGPLYIPGKTGCYECQKVVASIYGSEKNDIDYQIKAINSHFKPATFAPVNNLAAALCAGDVIKFIGQYAEPLSLNKRIGIWTDETKIHVQNMDRSPICSVCGCRM